MQAKWKAGDKVVGKQRGVWFNGLSGRVIGPYGVFFLVEFTDNGGHNATLSGWSRGPGPRWYVYPSQLEAVPAVTPTIASDLKITPQARSILNYLKKHPKGITNMEALISLGISRLSSCVHEIRSRAGYLVDTDIRHDDHGHRYSRYTLATVH